MKIIEFAESVKFYGPIIVILGAIFIYSVISVVLNKATIRGKTEYERKKRKTVILLFQNITKYVCLIFAILMILNIYGVNTSSIIAGLGIASVVIGLALQDALKDIISGINIIMDNYYVVGDYVKYGDFTGIITSFGLKSTKIKDFDGNVLNIANRNIDKIINISQERHVIYLRVPTAYEASEEKVKKVLLSVLEKLGELADVDGKECNYLGIDDLGDSAVKYLITIKCKQGSEYRVRRAALTLIKEAYDKNNIKIPYNQIEVHNGSKI